MVFRQLRGGSCELKHDRRFAGIVQLADDGIVLISTESEANAQLFMQPALQHTTARQSTLVENFVCTIAVLEHLQ